MLPLGVTIPATVPQRSEFPEGLMNCPVYSDRTALWTHTMSVINYSWLVLYFVSRMLTLLVR